LAAPAAVAQPQWKLTESLRIGGAESGPAALQYVKSIEVDALGRILIYDRSTQDVRMFAPDGKFVRTFSRKGSGPGEMRDAEGIVIVPGGNIWARDAANARFTVWDSAGKFLKQWTMHYCWSQGAWYPRIDARRRIVDFDCVVKDNRADGSAWVAYRTDMSGVDTLGAVPECGTRALAEAGTWITRTARGGSYRSIPWAPGSSSAHTAAGLLWCVPNSSQYEIIGVRDGSKDTVRVRRDAPRVPVTPFERDSVIAIYESRGPSGLDFSRIPKEKPAIDRLMLDVQDQLWVRHTGPGGTIQFDVFSANGRLIATASLGVVNSSVYQPYLIRRDALYLVALDEDDVPRIVRYDIRR
jgi:hypothetical protein